MATTEVTKIQEPTQQESLSVVDLRELESGLRARLKGVELIKSFLGSLLQKGVHYDIIPGTSRKDENGKEQAKPALLQPGAEDLALAARAHVEIVKEDVQHLPENHIDVTYWISMVKDDGRVLGQGVGSCSTMESKYRWRFSNKMCPNCQKETIKRSKPDKGGGWYCWSKIGGCGAQFLKGDATIEDQLVGKVPNEDIADTWNTVRKMAYKRALVAAAKVSFGVSSLFTQDVEEQAERGEDEPTPEPRRQAPPKAKAAVVTDVASSLDALGKIRKEVSDLMGRHAGHSGVPRDAKGKFDAAAYGEHVRTQASQALGGKERPETIADWEALQEHLQAQIDAMLEAEAKAAAEKKGSDDFPDLA